MRKLAVGAALVVSCLLALVPEAPPAASAAARRTPKPAKLRVLTLNLYLGADLVPVVEALSTDPTQAPLIVQGVWEDVVATRFATRARRIAAEIARLKPDVVALQEVALWRSEYPGDVADGNLVPDATRVEQDFARILRKELKRRRQRYRLRSLAISSDVEAPRFNPSLLDVDDLRFTDQDMILVRQGVRVTNDVQAANFQTEAVLPILGGVPVKRAYVTVDVKVRGRPVRVVATHLETLAEPIRHGQAQELLAGPLATTLPVVALGDFNTDAALAVPEPTYSTLTGAGLTDAWEALHPSDPGFTWGQDARLDNEVSKHFQRIDLVLFRGEGLTATRAELFGDSEADRIDGLWPSDHAGVFVEFVIE